MAEGCEIEHMARWRGGPAARFHCPVVKKRDTTGSIVDRVNAGFRPARGCIKLLDFSLSSIGWRRGLGRGGAFLLVAPFLGPLPTRSSRGEDGEHDAALRPPCSPTLPVDRNLSRLQKGSERRKQSRLAIRPFPRKQRPS
jgi:hypothetical protein